MQLKMYGYEIAQKLSKYSLHVYNNLQRIVSIDHIPKKIEYLKFVVVNLDRSDRPGTHWVVLSEQGLHILDLK